MINNVQHNFHMMATQQQNMQRDLESVRAAMTAMLNKLMDMESKPDTPKRDGIESSDYMSRTEVNELVAATRRQLEAQIADMRKDQNRANILMEANVTDKAERVAARTVLREMSRSAMSPPASDVQTPSLAPLPLTPASSPAPVFAEQVVAIQEPRVPQKKSAPSKRKNVKSHVTFDIQPTPSVMEATEATTEAV